MENTKKKNKLTGIVIFSLVIIAMGAYLWFGVFHTAGSQTPNICIYQAPLYTVNCNYQNHTIQAYANDSNIGVAINQDNCTIATEVIQNNLIACNETVNYTKYEIYLQKYGK